MGFFQSVGEILAGDGSNGGQRHETDEGASYTRGVAKDETVSSRSNYLSVGTSDGDKRTVVYGSDGKVEKDTGWRSKR